MAATRLKSALRLFRGCIRIVVLLGVLVVWLQLTMYCVDPATAVIQCKVARWTLRTQQAKGYFEFVADSNSRPLSNGEHLVWTSSLPDGNVAVRSLLNLHILTVWTGELLADFDIRDPSMVFIKTRREIMIFTPLVILVNCLITSYFVIFVVNWIAHQKQSKRGESD
jgi:hypothetical protein